MKKHMMMALVALIGAHGSAGAFNRDCQSGIYAAAKKSYTYSLNILSAQEESTICFVTLTTAEKDFIRQELASFSAATKVTRDFYVDNIKNQYNANKPNKAKGETKNKITALRRVVRDFGGSKQEGRKEHTVGDILKMLDGKLKDIGSKASAF